MSRSSYGFVVACALQGVALAAGAPVSAQRMHTVKRGETLSSIARRSHVDVGDLAGANDLSASAALREGETIELPPQGVTYVRAGQTLSHVARAHHCTVIELRRINGLRDGDNVRAGTRLRLPGYVPETVVDRDWGAPAQPGVVALSGRDGRASVELVDQQGRVRLKGLRALGEAMRRGDEDQSRHVHPRLALLLAKISDHFGGRAITVVSGFREAGGRTSESSRHVAGRAADIQVAGVPERLVWNYCLSLAQTGCGLYPHSVFVHVDVREQYAQWVDWSEPGKRARYGTLQRPWRKKELRSPDRPRVGRKITLPDEVPLAALVVNRRNEVVRSVDEASTQPASEEQDRASVDQTGDDGDSAF